MLTRLGRIQQWSPLLDLYNQQQVRKEEVAVKHRRQEAEAHEKEFAARVAAERVRREDVFPNRSAQNALLDIQLGGVTSRYEAERQ